MRDWHQAYGPANTVQHFYWVLITTSLELEQQLTTTQTKISPEQEPRAEWKLRCRKKARCFIFLSLGRRHYF